MSGRRGGGSGAGMGGHAGRGTVSKIVPLLKWPLLLFAFLILLARLQGVSLSSRDSAGSQRGLHKFWKRVEGLDARRYISLQKHTGRDSVVGIFEGKLKDEIDSYWTNIQRPFITERESKGMDTATIEASLDALVHHGGYATYSCPEHDLTRYTDKTMKKLRNAKNHYFIAITVSNERELHDHLASVTSLVRLFGRRRIFVSLVDYATEDGTEFMTDLIRSTFLLLGVSYKVAKLMPMSLAEQNSYFPAVEAYQRNSALGPLHELKRKGVTFHKVIWLKGFICPDDLLSLLRTSEANRASLTCGMDWMPQNKKMLFTDVWRSQDLTGKHFRRTESRSTAQSAPIVDEIAATAFAERRPFQVLCCESGTHVVDPAQTYYRGVVYRSAPTQEIVNATEVDLEVIDIDSFESRECMDSSQSHFCRDLWRAAEPLSKQAPEAPAALESIAAVAEAVQNMTSDGLLDDIVGTPEAEVGPVPVPEAALNKRDTSDSAIAKIVINPRAAVTYTDHTHPEKVWRLFGNTALEANAVTDDDLVVRNWREAPESHLCQEMRSTGGDTASLYERMMPYL